MTEKLLQYIWQFQYFNRSSLTTTDGEQLIIISPGQLNNGQGPDFKTALIKIGSTLFAGSVELHLKTSHWKDHGHQHDPNYRNVILHVVHTHNENTTPGIPVLELGPRIPAMLLQKYEHLMRSTSFIPCAGSVNLVNELVWCGWKDRLVAERLTRKTGSILQYLDQSNGHWEEVFWWMIARNFGSKINSEPFEALARSIPVNVLAKHKTQIHQLEALLLGQAGLLDNDSDDKYLQLLQREYKFLNGKYGLNSISVPVHFMRTRPANFPSVRLAQLAALVQGSSHFFSRILETTELKQIRRSLDVCANDYWHYHYKPGEESAYKIKRPGEEMIDNIIINTVVPMLFAYGCYHANAEYKNRALNWLVETRAEVNTITKGFRQLNIANLSAYDSQSLIELKTKYCDARHCLKCSIGNALLKLGDQRTERAFL